MTEKEIEDLIQQSAVNYRLMLTNASKEMNAGTQDTSAADLDFKAGANWMLRTLEKFNPACVLQLQQLQEQNKKLEHELQEANNKLKNCKEFIS